MDCGFTQPSGSLKRPREEGLGQHEGPLLKKIRTMESSLDRVLKEWLYYLEAKETSDPVKMLELECKIQENTKYKERIIYRAAKHRLFSGEPDLAEQTFDNVSSIYICYKFQYLFCKSQGKDQVTLLIEYLENCDDPDDSGDIWEFICKRDPEVAFEALKFFIELDTSILIEHGDKDPDFAKTYGVNWNESIDLIQDCKELKFEFLATFIQAMSREVQSNFQSISKQEIGNYFCKLPDLSYFFSFGTHHFKLFVYIILKLDDESIRKIIDKIINNIERKLQVSFNIGEFFAAYILAKRISYDHIKTIQSRMLLSKCQKIMTIAQLSYAMDKLLIIKQMPNQCQSMFDSLVCLLCHNQVGLNFFLNFLLNCIDHKIILTWTSGSSLPMIVKGEILKQLAEYNSFKEKEELMQRLTRIVYESCLTALVNEAKELQDSQAANHLNDRLRLNVFTSAPILEQEVKSQWSVNAALVVIGRWDVLKALNIVEEICGLNILPFFKREHQAWLLTEILFSAIYCGTSLPNRLTAVKKLFEILDDDMIIQSLPTLYKVTDRSINQKVNLKRIFKALSFEELKDHAAAFLKKIEDVVTQSQLIEEDMVKYLVKLAKETRRLRKTFTLLN